MAGNLVDSWAELKVARKDAQQVERMVASLVASSARGRAWTKVVALVVV